MTPAPGAEIHEVDPARPDEARIAVRAATRALRAGGLVIVPTETVYGLAARPDLPEATARIFAAKCRSFGRNLPILAASAERAWEVARPNPPARRLAEAIWPGALTLVLPRTDRSRSWELGDDRSTVAVRVPHHVLTTALLAEAGPLAVTSANRSGEPPLDDPRALVEAFGSTVAVYLVLARKAAPPGGTPSTVVDLTGAEPEVVRTGAVGPDEISRALG